MVSVRSRHGRGAHIAGDHDPVVLADMSESRMRAKKDQLALALDGNFGVHHGIVARQILDHPDPGSHCLSRLVDQSSCPRASSTGSPALSRRSTCCARSRAGVAAPRKSSSPRPAVTCRSSRPPVSSHSGQVPHPESTNQRASVAQQER